MRWKSKVKKTFIAVKIPIVMVSGDSDRAVPYDENGALLEKDYKQCGLPMLDIIKVGLYLLSRLQIPSWQIVDRLSQTYEKSIFYGAVYRKVCGIE